VLRGDVVAEVTGERVVKDGEWVHDGCVLCIAHDYTYRLAFGFDGHGPWAVLTCGMDGCEAHESVRPVWGDGDGLATTDADLFAALLDFAQDDGWELGHGAYCPQHADR
jgi:hypothetical protein